MKLKSLFTTPKRAILTSICAVGILAAAGTATAFAAESIAKSNSIGTAAAEEAALLDAGVSAGDAVFSRTDFEFEKGSFVYDVEFAANGIEWDYLIKASDGTVLSRKAKVQDGYQGLDAATPGTDGSVDVSSPIREESNGGADLSTPDTSTPIEETDIGLEAAKSAALADAGVNAADATFTEQKRDRDDGVLVYDIDFYTSDMKYEYEIDAVTGAVRERKSERRNNQTQPDTGTPDTSAPIEETDIGLEAAKSAALADAGVNAADTTFTEQKRDRDDGVLVYDIDFYTSDMKYEYEIDAATGAVRERKSERRNNQTQTGTTDIGLEAAKQIAFEHAGVSAGEVYLSKAKYENDDGIRVYEIEFYKDRMEYEYTIHATTGRILEFDAEYDD